MDDPEDYRCEKCGKWAHAEHNFREFLTCLMDGEENKEGQPWSRADSDAVADRTVEKLGRLLDDTRG